jgi:hypothetical protein
VRSLAVQHQAELVMSEAQDRLRRHLLRERDGVVRGDRRLRVTEFLLGAGEHGTDDHHPQHQAGPGEQHLGALVDRAGVLGLPEGGVHGRQRDRGPAREAVVVEVVVQLQRTGQQHSGIGGVTDLVPDPAQAARRAQAAAGVARGAVRLRGGRQPRAGRTTSYAPGN